MITGKLYDWLRSAQILLLIMATLYFVLGQIWDFPNAEELVGAIVITNTLLGILLGISRAKYNKEIARGGILMVTETDDGETFSLVLADDPDILKTKREVRFDIRKE